MPIDYLLWFDHGIMFVIFISYYRMVIVHLPVRKMLMYWLLGNQNIVKWFRYFCNSDSMEKTEERFGEVWSTKSPSAKGSKLLPSWICADWEELWKELICHFLSQVGSNGPCFDNCKRTKIRWCICWIMKNDDRRKYEEIFVRIKIVAARSTHRVQNLCNIPLVD